MQNLKIDKNNIGIHGNSNNNMLDIYELTVKRFFNISVSKLQ